MPRWPATKMRASLATSSLMAVEELEAVARDERVALRVGEVGGDHLLDQLLEGHLVLPAELAPRLTRVAQQRIDPGGAEVALVDAHPLHAFRVVGDLLPALARPGERDAELAAGHAHELAHPA